MEIAMQINRKIKDIYFEQASEAPLLSRQEEKDLAVKIAKWSKNKSNCSGHARKVAKAAKEKMIVSNLRLVIVIAQKYENNGVDLMDLINEGNMGLIESVERYDPNKGVKFSTYSALWIKQYIRRYLSNHSRTIRIPIPVFEEKTKVNKYKNNFIKKHNREPSFEEIKKRFSFSEVKLKRILECGAPVSSLDMTLNDDNTTTLENILEDLTAKNPASTIELRDLSDSINKILNKLTKREKYIIIRRFGLNNFEKETLDAIGKRYKLSRERIRQIETAAMRKIKFHVTKVLKIEK
jgi:RNA polymerase sigma factor (sigma-70 family)